MKRYYCLLIILFSVNSYAQELVPIKTKKINYNQLTQEQANLLSGVCQEASSPEHIELIKKAQKEFINKYGWFPDSPCTSPGLRGITKVPSTPKIGQLVSITDLNIEQIFLLEDTCLPEGEGPKKRTKQQKDDAIKKYTKRYGPIPANACKVVIGVEDNSSINESSRSSDNDRSNSSNPSQSNGHKGSNE
jgi:hypothetical protein